MTVEERNSSTDRSQTETRSRDEHKRALIGLATRMDEFLDSIGTRLVSILDECEHAVSEQASMFHKSSEFQQERNVWERQRQKEIAQIRRECKQLAEAWTRLEKADRNRLSGINGRANQSSVQSSVQPVVDASIDGASAMRPADAALIEMNAAASRPAPPVDDISPVSILMQFQQLKRDIRNHAQRKS